MNKKCEVFVIIIQLLYRVDYATPLFLQPALVGMGTIEKTGPLPLDAVSVGEASADDVAEASADDVAEASADDVAELDSLESVALAIALSEERRPLASAGDTVVVVEGLASLLPLLSFFRTSEPSPSGCELMKVIRGPATIALLWRSTAPAFSGWSSDVIQIATGPLMPSGTTHSAIGREREKGMPPMSIWQWWPCERGTRACVRRGIAV